MEMCSTSSLSTLDWTRLLKLWFNSKHAVYGNFTVTKFIACLHLASARNHLFVGRARGEISAFLIAEPRAGSTYVEAFVGPRRFFRAWAHSVTGRISFDRKGRFKVYGSS